jgi:hypothetical protein
MNSWQVELIPQLKELCEYRDDQGGNECCECPVCDAAMAIESLDEEVNKWRQIAERFAESDPRHDAFHAYFREVFPQ